MDFEVLFKKLDENDVRYLICGGLAVNLYGVTRMTADIDLLLDLTVDNIQQFQSVIRALNFFPVLPLPMKLLADDIKRLSLIEEKNLIAYSFYNSVKGFMNIDVIIDIPNSFDELWKRKETRTIDDYLIYILSIEDLIKLKEFANREQDKNDILMLRKMQNDRK
jgi:predicted nucleotidyltransferase